MGLKFLDLSGYGHCGKGAFTDLFREFNCTNVPNSYFEFDFLRVPGGLIDLSHAIIDNWSPFRSDNAIKRFNRLVKRSSTVPFFQNPYSSYISNGFNYHKYFNGSFIDISNEYIQELIAYQASGEWIHTEIHPFDYTIQRVLKKTGLKKSFPEKYFGVNSNGFFDHTNKYLNKLFSSANNNSHINILHNCIEPYNPQRGLDLFENCKMIIVRRDPRDIYLSTKVDLKSELFILDQENENFLKKYKKDSFKWKQEIVLSNNIDLFINRQKLLYLNSKNNKSDNRVLSVFYEDLIINYDETLKKIYDFCELSLENHNNKGKFFRPNDSIKNIKLWKKHKNSDVDKIYSELNELCYNK